MGCWSGPESGLYDNAPYVEDAATVDSRKGFEPSQEKLKAKTETRTYRLIGAQTRNFAHQLKSHHKYAFFIWIKSV